MSAGHVGHAGLCPCGGPKGGGATGAGSTGGAGTKATTFGSEAVIEATVWVLRMTTGGGLKGCLFSPRFIGGNDPI